MAYQLPEAAAANTEADEAAVRASGRRPRDLAEVLEWCPEPAKRQRVVQLDHDLRSVSVVTSDVGAMAREATEVIKDTRAVSGYERECYNNLLFSHQCVCAADIARRAHVRALADTAGVHGASRLLDGAKRRLGTAVPRAPTSELLWPRWPYSSRRGRVHARSSGGRSGSGGRG